MSTKIWAKAENCGFFLSQIYSLGYIVANKGIQMDHKKIDMMEPNGKLVRPGLSSKLSGLRYG